MKTVIVIVGGKEYSAAQLTVPERCEIARIMPALQESARELDFSKSTVLLREMLEIVCASIRRTGSNVPIEEVTKEWAIKWPDFAAVEVLKATQTLLDFIGEFPTRVNLDPRANLN
jgi:hypothetical protein